MLRAHTDIACGHRTSFRVLCKFRRRHGCEVWLQVLGARCRHQGTERWPEGPRNLKLLSQTSDTLMWQNRLGESRKITASRRLSIIEQRGGLQANLMRIGASGRRSRIGVGA